MPRATPEAQQCEALAPGSAYTNDHRCLKVVNLEKVRGHLLCVHHRAVRGVRLWADWVLRVR